MKACIIGAGSSGIAAAQVLQARGIDFDCFEKGSTVGGNWRYENDNGMSSAYRSLHINTSRRVMAFKSLPMPEGYPDYPDHFQMAAYFDEVVDRYRLRERIQFNTEVPRAWSRSRGAGEWDVTVEGPEGRADRPLRRGARRQRPPLGRALARTRLPRRRGVRGRADPRARIPRARRRCAASGCWCSGSATPPSTSRSSPRGSATKTFLATRRGAWVLPKYLNGKPIDEIANAITGNAPIPVQRAVIAALAEGGGRRPDRLRAAEARPQAARGAPDRLLGVPARASATATSPRSRTSTASPAAARVRFVDGIGRGDRPRRLLHGLQDHLPVLRPRGALRPRQQAAALPPRRLGRASRPLLHRLHPAARPDHADRRGAGGMDRRPALRPGGATGARRRCGGRSRSRKRSSGSASSPLSVIPSRSTSIRISARSGASESGLRRRPDDPRAAARRAVGQRLGDAAAVGTAARAARQFRRHLAPLVAAVVLGLLRLRDLLVARPPDEPDRPQHRDLENDHQEEDRPETRSRE